MEIKNVKRFYWDFAIILLLMFGFGYLPAFEPITAQGMRILGILFACIYAWTIGSSTWPSLLALMALGFLPGNTVTSVFVAAFGNQTLLMVLFCLIFCHGVEKSGLLAVIAKFMLSRKFAKKSPWMLAFAFLATACVASMLCSSIAVTIFLWTIFYDVIVQLNLPRKSPYVAMVMIGITITAYLGNSVLPFGPFLQIGIAVMTAVNPAFVMNYAAYSTLALILCIVVVPLLTVVFKLICPKFEYEVIDEIVDAKDLRLTIQQKIALAVVALVCFVMMAPSFMPKEWAVHGFLENFGVIGGMCGASVLMMVIVVNGHSLGDIVEGMKRSIPWDLYFLLAAALAISTAVTAEGTGVKEFLRVVMSPLLANKTALIFLAILVIIGAVITNCLNNIVTLTLLIPTALAFSAGYGISAQMLVAVFAIILYQGVVLPSGSVMGAMLHGNREWLTAGQIYKYASVGELVLALSMIVVGLPIGLYLLFH